MVVATKFLPRTNEEIAEGISGQEHIRRMLVKSLQNLGVVDLTLTEECVYLEELYIPHHLVGIMTQNTLSAAKGNHAWSTGSQVIGVSVLIVLHGAPEPPFSLAARKKGHLSMTFFYAVNRINPV